MRLWSFHPKYLDDLGRARCFGEGALALRSLRGEFNIHKNHSGLKRFKETGDPERYLEKYLYINMQDLEKRGKYYKCFNILKFRIIKNPINVTRGQLLYEWNLYLYNKLKMRNPELFEKYRDIKIPELHPLFMLTEGPVESWEKLKKIKKRIQ